MTHLLCKVGVHAYRFQSCDPFAMCAAEICKHCGRGRIMHFAGAYQYFDAKAMSASGQDAKQLEAQPASADPQGFAQGTTP